MRLHRYFGSHADTTLSEKRLLLAKVSTFNDPFEFVHSFIGDYTVDNAEQDLELMADADVHAMLSKIEGLNDPNYFSEATPRRRLAEFYVGSGGRPPVDPFHCHQLADDFFRLCCFSLPDVTADSEILLWSHYARSHHGVRIEFELDEHSLPLSKVRYSRRRCAIDFSKAHDGDHTNDVMLQTFQTKALAWQYENEVRLIIKKECAVKRPIPLDFKYYFPFDPSWVKAVDFGINCDSGTISKIRSILRMEYPHVMVRQACHHPEDYAIEYRTL